MQDVKLGFSHTTIELVTNRTVSNAISSARVIEYDRAVRLYEWWRRRMALSDWRQIESEIERSAESGC